MALDSFASQWFQRHRNDDGSDVLLNHYTNLAGMQGIIRERSIWLGHIGTFNDPGEVLYGKNLVSGILGDVTNNEEDPNIQKMLRHMALQVNHFLYDTYHPFVACFCESGDLLSQWRAYGNKGSGYCLNFSFSNDVALGTSLDTLENGPHLFLRKVVYDADEQRDFVSRYVEMVIEAAREALRTASGDTFDMRPIHMGVDATDLLLDMIMCFKQPAFHEENEWRLMRITRDDHEPETIRFREQEGILVPFRPQYLFERNGEQRPRFPLKSVCCGPSSNSARNRAATDLFLRHAATVEHPIELLAGIEVRVSGFNLS
jgi:hypothetical protein